MNGTPAIARQKRKGVLQPGPDDLKCDRDEVHHLKLALRSCLDAYDRLTHVFPKKSIAHGCVVEAFGHVPLLAEELLKND